MVYVILALVSYHNRPPDLILFGNSPFKGRKLLEYQYLCSYELIRVLLIHHDNDGTLLNAGIRERVELTDTPVVLKNTKQLIYNRRNTRD